MAYIKRKEMRSGKTDPTTGKFVKDENTNKWTGPFANKTGEWVINHIKEFPIERNDVRVGKPKWCTDMTSEKLAEMGFQGLYLTRNIVVTGDPSVFVEIDTNLLDEEVVSGQQKATKGIDPKYTMEKE